jgi:hypothetical protein
MTHTPPLPKRSLRSARNYAWGVDATLPILKLAFVRVEIMSRRPSFPHVEPTVPVLWRHDNESRVPNEVVQEACETEGLRPNPI